MIRRTTLVKEAFAKETIGVERCCLTGGNRSGQERRGKRATAKEKQLIVAQST